MKTLITMLAILFAPVAFSATDDEKTFSNFLTDVDKAVMIRINKPTGINPKHGKVVKEAVYIIDGYRYTLWYIQMKNKQDEFRVYVRKDGTTDQASLDSFNLHAHNMRPRRILLDGEGWIEDVDPEIQPSEKMKDFYTNHMSRLSKFLK